jgi:F-type H+-transporting ATPase subunit delta
MSVSRITTRYAKSLFDLAQETGKLEAAHQDMRYFAQVAQQSDFRALLKSPVVKADKKGKIFDVLFGDKIDRMTNGFIHLILRKGREEYLEEIARDFIQLYRRYRNITTVKIVSAVPFGEAAQQNLVARLKANGIVTGEAEITNEVDPDVIGGFIMHLNDKIYDASVDFKLEKLRRLFSENTFVRSF